MKYPSARAIRTAKPNGISGTLIHAEEKRNLQEMRYKEIRYTIAINERCF